MEGWRVEIEIEILRAKKKNYIYIYKEIAENEPSIHPPSGCYGKGTFKNNNEKYTHIMITNGLAINSDKKSIIISLMEGIIIVDDIKVHKNVVTYPIRQTMGNTCCVLNTCRGFHSQCNTDRN